MPIYEYECPVCGKKKDVRTSIYVSKNDDLVLCDSCNLDMVRVITSPGYVYFKGQGFYVNDSKEKKDD